MASWLYQTDGRVRNIHPSNGSHWTDTELRSLVDGIPSRLRTVDGGWMVVNDNYWALQLEPNFPATRIYERGHKWPILGPAVVVDTLAELQGPEVSDGGSVGRV